MKRVGWLDCSRVLILGVFFVAVGYSLLHTGGALAQEPPVAEDPQSAPFGVGSKAPDLDIEHWLSDGNGQFKPIKKFEDGHVYIIEFWATWCGPCISSMPHLVETQQKYKDKKVQLISVSDEDLDTVNEFLDRSVRGRDDQTYRELTQAYCLTTDPNRSVHKSYMEAAGQNGIPTAFIVGKKGVIEWIGHPMEMDDPLEQVVSDRWDRQAHMKAIEAQQAVQRMLGQVVSRLQMGETDEALEMLDKMIGDSEDPEISNSLRSIKLSIMMQMGVEEEKLIPAARDVLKLVADQPMALNNLAWAIAGMAGDGVISDKAFLAEVAEMTEKAAAAAGPEDDWSILDTAGHLYYHAGNLNKAIEVQKKAAANPNSEEAPEVAEFLKKLEAERDRS